jgi:hypothetical protein
MNFTSASISAGVAAPAMGISAGVAASALGSTRRTQRQQRGPGGAVGTKSGAATELNRRPNRLAAFIPNEKRAHAGHCHFAPPPCACIDAGYSRGERFLGAPMMCDAVMKSIISSHGLRRAVCAPVDMSLSRRASDVLGRRVVHARRYLFGPAQPVRDAGSGAECHSGDHNQGIPRIGKSLASGSAQSRVRCKSRQGDASVRRGRGRLQRSVRPSEMSSIGSVETVFGACKMATLL